MATTWSCTLLGEGHVAPGISGTLNINKFIWLSCVGPATAVANGNGLDVSDYLSAVAFGWFAGYKANADNAYKCDLLIASGNSGADLKVLTTRLYGSSVTVPAQISAGAVLTGVEARLVLFGWG